MPIHSYTPKQALDLLFRKIADRFPELYRRMKDAIDEGKDELEQERMPGPGRRVRSYRKNLPYTDEEALGVALIVLESHLIETRRLIEAADREFAKVETAPPKRRESEGDDSEDVARSRVAGKDEPKKIEIEVEPETVLEKQGEANVPLKSVMSQDLAGLEAVFRHLQELTHFTGDQDGHTS